MNLFSKSPVPLPQESTLKGAPSESSPTKMQPGKIEKDMSLPSITDLETGVEVRFNPPREITIDKVVVWQPWYREPNDILELTATEPKTLQRELVLESESNVYEAYIRKLEDMTLLRGEVGGLRRPPRCQFRWGESFPRFEEAIENLNVKYTLFLPDGTPVRATVNLRMRHATQLRERSERESPR